MLCKACKEYKIKEPTIRKNVTRFVDQLGRLWNGKVCPDRYKIYNRERMRFKRLQHKSDETSTTLKID
jgi:hypothetical protein